MFDPRLHQSVRLDYQMWLHMILAVGRTLNTNTYNFICLFSRGLEVNNSSSYFHEAKGLSPAHQAKRFVTTFFCLMNGSDALSSIHIKNIDMCSSIENIHS